VYYWTADMDRAVGFYGDVIGLTLLSRHGDAWAEFDGGAIRFALHGSVNRHMSPPGGTAVFEVDDLDSARRELEARGVGFDEHVGEVEGLARFASFADPDGNAVQIIEYLRKEG
jgi:CreA protein